ncbi:hypothetical protein Hanom_Chr00s180048g01831551 [Helianthus anomalus]
MLEATANLIRLIGFCRIFEDFWLKNLKIRRTVLSVSVGEEIRSFQILKRFDQIPEN